MSMGFESILQSTPTGSDIALEMGDIKLQYNAALDDLRVVSASFESYMNACERYLALCDCVEANEGMLEPAVRDFVNRNGELAMALGIDLAMEDDSQDAQKENGNKVQEKKQGFFRRIWEAIKAFIKKILDGIGNFFHWLGSFFNANDKKIDDISKNADKIADKAKEPATEAFSSSTDHKNSMTAEVLLADPERTSDLLSSYRRLLEHAERGIDSLIPLLSENNPDTGATFSRVLDALESFRICLQNQKNNGTNLVDFTVEYKTITDKRGTINDKTFTYESKDFKYPYITLTAPKRIMFKSPNVKTMLSAYAALGWIEKPVLTSGFKHMEENFKYNKGVVESIAERFKAIDSGLSLSGKKVDRFSVNRINMREAAQIIHMYCQMTGKLASTYGIFYKKFGQMLDDIHSVIGDKPQN